MGWEWVKLITYVYGSIETFTLVTLMVRGLIFDIP